MRRFSHLFPIFAGRKLQHLESMVTEKKYSLKDIRNHRHVVSKAPVAVSVNVGDNPKFVGLQTRHPIQVGLRSLVTLRGDIRPYMRYLEGTDITDMASDWRLVGSDIRIAMNYLKQQ